jgi:uncharacterized ubiquitin-like protein YukD
MKINVEVNTPGNNKVYEFQISDNLLVSTVVSRLIDMISEHEEQGIAFNPDTVTLLNHSDEKVLDPNNTLYQENVKNGDVLMLL